MLSHAFSISDSHILTPQLPLQSFHLHLHKETTMNLLCSCVFFLLLAQNHVHGVILFSQATTIGISPAPSPQPPTTLPKYGATPGSLQPRECVGRCTVRCSKTSFRKPCMFFCNKCCSKCLCVPPGTYGNKQVCPCYNNWKTKRGGPKCP